MGEAAARTKLSEQEYLAFERAAEDRHDYADGEIFAMPGGTWEHSLIASNIRGELSTALLERRCAVHGSDMRIHIPSTGRYTYSDVLVVGGQPVFTDEARDTLVNPILIVEVRLSRTMAPRVNQGARPDVSLWPALAAEALQCRETAPASRSASARTRAAGLMRSSTIRR